MYRVLESIHAGNSRSPADALLELDAVTAEWRRTSQSTLRLVSGLLRDGDVDEIVALRSVSTVCVLRLSCLV